MSLPQAKQLSLGASCWEGPSARYSDRSRRDCPMFLGQLPFTGVTNPDCRLDVALAPSLVGVWFLRRLWS